MPFDMQKQNPKKFFQKSPPKKFAPQNSENIQIYPQNRNLEGILAHNKVIIYFSCPQPG